MKLHNQKEFNKLLEKYQNYFPILFLIHKKKFIKYILNNCTELIGRYCPNSNQTIITNHSVLSKKPIHINYHIGIPFPKSLLNQNPYMPNDVFIVNIDSAEAVLNHFFYYIIYINQFPNQNKASLQEIFRTKLYRKLFYSHSYEMNLINIKIKSKIIHEAELIKSLDKMLKYQNSFVELKTQADYKIAGLLCGNCLGTIRNSFMKHKVFINKNKGVIAYSYIDLLFFDYIKDNLGYRNKKIITEFAQLKILSFLKPNTRFNYLKSIIFSTIFDLTLLPLSIINLCSLYGFSKIDCFILFLILLLINCLIEKQEIKKCFYFYKAFKKSLNI